MKFSKHPLVAAALASLLLVAADPAAVAASTPKATVSSSTLPS